MGYYNNNVNNMLPKANFLTEFENNYFS